MRGFMLAVSLAVTPDLTLAGPLQAQNLLLDGDFEQPVVAPGTQKSFPSGRPLNKWAVIADGRSGVRLVSGTYQSNSVTFAAQSGGQWLNLNGSTGSLQGVQQVVPTVARTTYRLSFWVGSIDLLSRVEVYVNGVFQTAAIYSGPPSAFQWQQFTTTFTAPSASTTIALAARSGNNPNLGVDNVQLVAVP
jgi:hypothetical protein